MLVELVEIKKNYSGAYFLNTIYLNPKHIVYISEDRKMSTLVSEGKVGLGIVQGAAFSKIKLNESNYTNEIVVVGDPSTVEHKIFMKTKKQILRG